MVRKRARIEFFYKKSSSRGEQKKTNGAIKKAIVIAIYGVKEPSPKEKESRLRRVSGARI